MSLCIAARDGYPTQDPGQMSWGGAGLAAFGRKNFCPFLEPRRAHRQLRVDADGLLKGRTGARQAHVGCVQRRAVPHQQHTHTRMQGSTLQRHIAYHARPCAVCGSKTATQVMRRLLPNGGDAWWCSERCRDRLGALVEDPIGRQAKCWICGKWTYTAFKKAGDKAMLPAHAACFDKKC